MKFLTMLFAFFLIGFNSQANAENLIQITNIQHASNFDLGDGTATPVIWGGIVGPIANCTNPLSDDTFCNNCDPILHPDEACNTKRIHNRLLLRIEFKVTADVVGHVHFGYNRSGTIIEFPYYTKTPGVLKRDDIGYVELTWGELCQTIDNFNCDWLPGYSGETIATFISIENGRPNWNYDSRTQIIVDMLGDVGTPAWNEVNEITCSSLSPSAGFCGMTVYPGNQKVYISDLIIQNSCPSTFRKARVFYSNTGLNLATYGAAYKDFNLGPNCEPIGEWTINGLENDLPYFFRIAIVDAANNVMHLIDDQDILISEPDCASLDGDLNCSYLAVPSLNSQWMSPPTSR